MPGRLFLETSVAQVAAALGASGDAVADEVPRRNIAPGQNLLALTDDKTLTRMRWGLIPVGRVNARGRPVLETLINARSETPQDRLADLAEGGRSAGIRRGLGSLDRAGRCAGATSRDRDLRTFGGCTRYPP